MKRAVRLQSRIRFSSFALGVAFAVAGIVSSLF